MHGPPEAQKQAAGLHGHAASQREMRLHDPQVQLVVQSRQSQQPGPEQLYSRANGVHSPAGPPETQVPVRPQTQKLQVTGNRAQSTVAPMACVQLVPS